jgi:hypothetical protein
VRAAFPKGYLYVDLRTEFGTLYDNQLFARRFDLRQSRYIGLARTHLRQLLKATALNVVRVIAWFWGEPLGERRRKPGHFAQLAPHPLSRQAVLR